MNALRNVLRLPFINSTKGSLMGYFLQGRRCTEGHSVSQPADSDGRHMATGRGMRIEPEFVSPTYGNSPEDA